MADNVSVTPGTGAAIAADDVGSVFYQRVKLDGGGDGASAPILGDSTNGLYVNVRQSQRLATYRAAHTSTFAAPNSAANPFFVLYGSSTKTIRVKKIRVSGMTQAAVAYLSMQLVKYSTAPSGGTPVTMTMVPLDSTDAAATASLCQVYTATPTTGTEVGHIGSVRHLVENTTAAAGAMPKEIEWDFTSNGDDRGNLVLRGTAQGIGLELSAATATNLTVEVEWTEET